jgi:hypothetical protein
MGLEQERPVGEEPKSAMVAVQRIQKGSVMRVTRTARGRRRAAFPHCGDWGVLLPLTLSACPSISTERPHTRHYTL